MVKRSMLVYAIIPARSGSKGLKDKNIKKLAGKELLGYSIEFALSLNVNRVFCSTDSKKYADIAISFGAEAPFLRAPFASSDAAMEEHILEDLYKQFDVYNIKYPDLFVWLRPTFPFRRKEDVLKCIHLLNKHEIYSAARVVVEAESRLYGIEGDIIKPMFNDHNKSMIRRQDVTKAYRVFQTDVFRGNPKNISPDFLGRYVAYVIADKIAGIDIDDEIDFSFAQYLIEKRRELLNDYLSGDFKATSG